MFKRKDWWIIFIALILALGLFVLTRSGIQPEQPGENDPSRILVEVNAASNADTNKENPMAYLILTVGDTKYSPLPIYREATYQLHQTDGRDNVIHVTRDSVFMESASCDNQDCVKQGTVSLFNKETRVLGNMIICLPNQVVLELLTKEEAGTENK